MKPSLILVALMLSACAQTPQQVVDLGEKLTVSSQKPPQAAADCMARNADDFQYPKITARIRPGTVAGSVEVVGQDTGGTLIFARAEPAGSGSSISVWMSPNLIFYERSMGRDLVKNC
jgi:hypothetical protein